jgi:hypothetical protein
MKKFFERRKKQVDFLYDSGLIAAHAVLFPYILLQGQFF